MIRTIANTKAELNIAKERLNLLMDKKQEIYAKYFSLTAKMSDTPARTNKITDLMAEYVAEITVVNSITGMSLDDEIEHIRNEINKLEYYIRIMEYNIAHTSGIENDLFKKIAINGLSPTKAVERVADKYDMHTDSIWKYHYKKIEKELKKFMNV